MAIRAVILAALVACAAAQAAAPKAAAPATAATVAAAAPQVAAKGATTAVPTAAALAGRYCHHSCYVGVKCDAAIAAKTKNLQLSKVPFKVEATGCNVNGCDAIMLQSFPTQAAWSQFQTLEDTDAVLSANYKAAGLKSATPAGLTKSGPCTGFLTFKA